MSRLAAHMHDERVLQTFCTLFGIPSEQDWDTTLHGVEYDTWIRQARLPLRMGGCGLRDSSAVRRAAYWASFADALPDLMQRFPQSGGEMLHYLTAAQAHDENEALLGPVCLMEAELAGKWCSGQGWDARPLWVDLAAGLRPPDNDNTVQALGEWKHGWQFHASDVVSQRLREVLIHDLSGPSYRINAATPGKARLRSCSGPFSSTWLTVCPTTSGMVLPNWVLQFAMRRRLGIAVCFDGPDVHGHAVLARRGAAMNARHSTMTAGWRQVLTEAGGRLPHRNVERMLSNTHVPGPEGDHRRLDLIVPGLNVDRGLTLFCDATIVSPIAGSGDARPGTSNRDGSLLDHAEADNNEVYHEVLTSGAGSLQCLGSGVYRRWGNRSVKLVPALAREFARGLHPRVRRGTAMALQHRWWGLLGIALQKSVAHMVLNADAGDDLFDCNLEPMPALSDLAILA
jgi:hypothetical protein